MAPLTSKARNALPTKDFAGPDRSYPIENASHARNALARASEELRKGNLSQGDYQRIVQRAHAFLGRDPTNYGSMVARARGYT